MAKVATAAPAPDEGPQWVLVIRGKPYFVEPIRDAGRLTGFQLTRDGAEPYQIDATGPRWECSCPDATYRPDRQFGCKHAAGLRRALRQFKGVRP